MNQELFCEAMKEGLITENVLDWDKLIEKNDYQLFLKYKDLPSGLKLYVDLIDDLQTIKTQYAFCILWQIDAKKIAEEINRHDDGDSLPDFREEIKRNLLKGMADISDKMKFIMNDFNRKKMENEDNGLKSFIEGAKTKFDFSRGVPRIWLEEQIFKEKERKILFEKIIKNKDLEFFELACKDDKENIDWALNNIDKKNIGVVELLLNNGAMVVRKIEETDDEGYTRTHEVRDELETQILKEQIKKLRELRK